MTALDKELQAEPAPLKARLKPQIDALTEAREYFEYPETERPETQVDAPDESAWLFDSARDYLTQLDYYQARKAGRE